MELTNFWYLERGCFIGDCSDNLDKIRGAIKRFPDEIIKFNNPRNILVVTGYTCEDDYKEIILEIGPTEENQEKTIENNSGIILTNLSGLEVKIEIERLKRNQPLTEIHVKYEGFDYIFESLGCLNDSEYELGEENRLDMRKFVDFDGDEGLLKKL